MASDKRSLVGFNDFPGTINIDTNNYEFPTLYKTASTGKAREWSIYIRLIKEGSKDQGETKSQNWNMMAEDQVPIKPEYLADQVKVPNGIIAELWTESGVMGMKISRSAASYIVAKNVGKKNERNTLQQALVNARSKYLKKLDEGSVMELVTLTQELIISAVTKFYPMLAKKYEDFIKKIEFSRLLIQPKLDGSRCIAFLDTIDSPTYMNVVLYSRQQKDWPHNEPNNNIRKDLLQFLIKNYDTDQGGSIFLDGELYDHDKSLQEIQSIVRGKGEDGEDIQYWVYDHFYPSYDKEPFSERVEILEKKFLDGFKDSKDSKNSKNYIKLVETTVTETEEECDNIYKKYLAAHYEGIMVRTPNGPYLKSAVKKSEQLRSKDLLKRKEIYDDEFEVVDYTEGSKGKDVGAIVWICAVGKYTFNAVPNLTHDERYNLFNECKADNFDSKYKNRMMTVEYRGLSNNGIPLQAKAIAFRDYK